MATSSSHETAFPDPRPATLVREFPAAARSVREAREAAADLAARHGADATRVDDVRLAVSEAATNVVVHAYEHETQGGFRMLMVAGHGQMIVVIDDDGRGLSSPARTPGLGTGLRVMRETADQALFRERAYGGSSVQLRFSFRD